MDALEQGFRLEELCIEPLAGEVSGRGGREKLDPKVMDVLVFMARHAGRVVLREDLLKELWPGVVVTDDALTRCFYELRRQLSRAGRDEKYRTLIETLPKRGYRLNGTVAPIVAPADSLRRERPRRRLSATGVGASVAVLAAATVGLYLTRSPEPAMLPARSASSAPKSIAVLPFVDMSEGRDQQYFSDGITEEILDRLTKAGDLRVIARTSSFSFRNRPADIPEIATRLNVSHVLEGSVRKAGDRIRITVQLVEGAGASHVWSDTYDHELGELFAVQDEIASEVAAALQVALAEISPGGTMPVSAASHDDFLQAKFLYDRRAPGDVELAVKYYEAAVSRDPGYAKAWAALSGAYALMWWELSKDPNTWRARQGEAARKAVELDPKLVEAHARLAQYYFDVSDIKRATEHWRMAAALDPNDPWLAGFLGDAANWHGDDLEQEIEVDRKGIRDDPYSAVRRMNFGLLLFAAGHLDEALSQYQRALELNPGAGWDKPLEIGRVLVAQKRFDEAQAAIMRLPVEGRDYGLALLYHAPGRRAEAETAFGRLKTRSSDHMHGIRVAEAYAFRGMVEQAFDTLQRSRDTLVRDESILTRIWNFQREMRVSPFLNPLHADARWARLMAQPEGDSAQEIIERLWPSAQGASVTG